MIAIIDYGAGNLFSVQNALNYLGFENTITHDADTLRKADGLILPGVGAFPDAMRMLQRSGLVDIIKEEAVKKPFLGICLGMQLLFTDGYEFEHVNGLNLIPGSVKRIQCPYKIPHMGWNQLHIRQDCPILGQVQTGDSVYFVHSFRAFVQPEYLVADTVYGDHIPAMVQNGNVYGCQFHPEKSGELGLTILKAFAERAAGV